MPTTLQTKSIADDYLRLIQRFALKRITSDAQNNAALEVTDTLMGREDLSPGQRDYLSALATLIADYETRTLPPREKVTPVELLKHLMAENKMNATALGKIVGSQPAASMILSGKRAISKAQAKRLAVRFRLDAGAFI